MPPEPALDVLGDHYLDVRQPAWRGLERAGRVRARRGLVRITPSAVEVRLALMIAYPSIYPAGPWRPVALAVSLFGVEVVEVRPARAAR